MKFCIYLRPMMENLNKKYEEFLNTTGDNSTRLRQIGLTSIPVTESPINTFEEFKAALTACGTVNKDSMIRTLKKCYKNYISKGDLAQLLKNGESGFSDSEVFEASRLLPVDIDGGLSVDDLVEFLYK